MQTHALVGHHDSMLPSSWVKNHKIWRRTRLSWYNSMEVLWSTTWPRVTTCKDDLQVHCNSYQQGLAKRGTSAYRVQGSRGFAAR